jgi:hypothetical protein
MKILIISLTFHPGFELSDGNLSEELEKKNFNITYALKSNEMYNPINKKVSNLYCGFPGFKKSILKKIKVKKKLLFNSWFQLKKLIREHDLIILGGYRNSFWIIKYSRLLGKRIFYHKNPAEMSIDCKITPDVFFLKDIFQKKQIKSSLKYNSLNKFSNLDKFLVTGSLQYQSIFEKKKLNYKNFCKKYNLDFKKDLVLFLPLGPQHHTKQYKEDYKKICDKLESKFNLLIKGHPADIFKRKNTQFYNKNKHSWEILGIDNICKPADFYEAIQYSKCCVSIYSTVFVEVNLNNKPIIFVNKYDHIHNMMTNKFKKFSKKNYNHKLGWHKYELPKSILKTVFEEMKKKGTIKKFKNNFYWYFDKSTEFYGKDVIFEDMIKAINSLPVKKKFSLRSKIIGNNFSPLNNMIINIEKYLINAKKNKFNFKNFILYLFEEFRDILIYLYQIIKKQ